MVAALFAAALALARAEDAGAADACALITELHPTHAKAWALRSLLALAASRVELAVAHAERAVAAKPALPAARCALARALTERAAQLLAEKPQPCDGSDDDGSFDDDERRRRRRDALELVSKAASCSETRSEAAQYYYRLARAARSARDCATACAALERCLELEPFHERAAFWLAALRPDARHSAPPAHAPLAHVKGLYDGYADRYDAHLTTALRSRTPELVASALALALKRLGQLRCGGEHDDGADALLLLSPSSSSSSHQIICDDGGAPTHSLRQVLDLGCGTGLSGAALRAALSSRVSLTGVDLSKAMCERAELRGCYDDVRQGELVATLRNAPKSSADALACADVLVYAGDLAPFFSAARHAASDKALLAFSLEDRLHPAPNKTQEAHDRGWDLAHTGRYRHAPHYAVQAATAHAWHLISLQPHVLRQNAGEPVAGHIFVFQAALQPLI